MGGENVLGGNTCGPKPAGTNYQELPPPSTRRGEIVKKHILVNVQSVMFNVSCLDCKVYVLLLIYK